jgi:hypothetical protein
MKVELESLEKVSVKFDKSAFRPSKVTCTTCKKGMKKSEIIINLDQNMTITLQGFECDTCKRKYLSLEEATKLDKAFVLIRMIENDFKMTRALSFDGDNFTFRIPKEFTHDVQKRKIEIVPLGAKKFCATVE